MDLRRITDFDAPELDVYARLTENQLLNRADPQNALFVAESPLVIGRALDAGCAPVVGVCPLRCVSGEGVVRSDGAAPRWSRLAPAFGCANALRSKARQQKENPRNLRFQRRRASIL